MKRFNGEQRQGISVSQRRGILLLIPIAVVVSVILFFVKRPSSGVEMDLAPLDTLRYAQVEVVDSVAAPFVFDPNTADLKTFIELGIPKRTAVSIIKYRDGGKVFRIKEEFAICYGLREEEYFRLEPYIVIGEEFRRKKRQYSVKDHETGKSGVVKSDTAKYISVQGAPARVALVSLNGADSAALRSVRGIGAYTAGQIIAYRDRLGGFVRDSQLLEVRGMKDDNFRMICAQIFVDSCEIKKIDVNFASPQRINNLLLGHPYAGAVVVRKLLKNRQLKGGWRNIGDMVKDETVTDEQAIKLAPYLLLSEF